ncbi:hypothetical protein [Enterobacter roggenkampii]|uniref:hypothetical protein n=1 Tax=Enterobacter roggenkampii TaxID=1812935 RepID=UPI001C704DD4|nr:hypothetical protein [Enterobacter roggenkampii]MBW9438425.1 hypothetical protein [Enterobacter roggenkampii]
MDKQTIQNIMHFMLRVNLTGQEVPAFTVAMNALQSELERPDDAVNEVINGANK